MQPLTPDFQKMLEIGSLLGGVSTIGIIAFIVKAFIDGSKRKKDNGKADEVTVLLLQQQSETLKSLSANLTAMVTLNGMQANILGGIANGIQEIKIDTANLPSVGKQLQEIQTCLAVVKDRLNQGN
jgi:hypothetical protein